ncbi:hypothetical protein BJV82DRAFT_516911, partial [Fennellomyces sp. T-0311]
YNDENVVKYSKIIDNLEDIEICYRTDPTKPMLLCTRTINSDPFHIFKYPKKSGVMSSTSSLVADRPKMKLATLAQVTAFLDAVYLPENPNNTEAYEPISISVNDVLALLWQHTYLMSDFTPIGLSRWCSTSKIDFMTVLPKRKLMETGQKVSIRPVFALKPVYIGTVYQFF